jgi:RND family efflux transporter MFP subunit
VNPGENTQIGQPLFRLGTLENVLMMAEVAQEKVGSVTIGLRAEVGFDAFPGEIFRGEVVKIDPNTNPATHAFPAFIRIANPGLRLKPGLTGFTRIQRKKTTLAVPSIAVLNPVGDHASVFIVDAGDRARQREIRTGVVGGGMVEVLAGVEEGEKVVTVGQLGLKEYDLVPK